MQTKKTKKKIPGDFSHCLTGLFDLGEGFLMAVAPLR